jgi:hypothetical protein
LFLALYNQIMSDQGDSPSQKQGSAKIPSNWAQKWSDEEDKRLLEGIHQYGENNWRLVAQVVGTRDPGKDDRMTLRITLE